MDEIFRKFYNRGIKIAWINLILITKSINLQLFTFILYGVGVHCDWSRFSVLSPFMEKSMAKLINDISLRKISEKKLHTAVIFPYRGKTPPNPSPKRLFLPHQTLHFALYIKSVFIIIYKSNPQNFFWKGI